jgi:hypothetical protein
MVGGMHYEVNESRVSHMSSQVAYLGDAGLVSVSTWYSPLYLRLLHGLDFA